MAAVLTYIISNKKARTAQAKILSEIQSHAIEQVRLAEDTMRAEIWSELQKVRDENAGLKEEMRQQGIQIDNLEKQLAAATQLRITLTEQVHTMESLIETYKNRIIELEKIK